MITKRNESNNASPQISQILLPCDTDLATKMSVEVMRWERSNKAP